MLKTKFGNARLDNDGRYRITSSKEGNNTKYLHRLIWEDFYKCEIPKGYQIHHKNGIKTDNCILNLQLIKQSEHMSIHKKGCKYTDEGKHNISKSKNTTGYFRVTKKESEEYSTGELWSYKYTENGKTYSLSSIHLDVLKEKVLAEGLEWKKF